MTRQDAVYLAYCMGEALNTPAMKALLAQAYGTKGIDGALQGMKSLAEQYEFELPVMAR